MSYYLRSLIGLDVNFGSFSISDKKTGLLMLHKKLLKKFLLAPYESNPPTKTLTYFEFFETQKFKVSFDQAHSQGVEKVFRFL